MHIINADAQMLPPQLHTTDFFISPLLCGYMLCVVYGSRDTLLANSCIQLGILMIFPLFRVCVFSLQYFRMGNANDLDSKTGEKLGVFGEEAMGDTESRHHSLPSSLRKRRQVELTLSFPG